MVSCRPLLPFALIAAGCAAASPGPDRGPQPIVASATATPPVVDAGPPPDVTGVASIGAPAATSACTMIAKNISYPLALRAAPGAPPFAAVTASELKATVLPSGGLFVEAQPGALRLRGR